MTFANFASYSILALYFGVKGGAYAGWCYAGVRRFAPAHGSPRRMALALGLLRLLLGLGFGTGIFLASAALFAGLREAGAFDPTAAMLVTYLAVYGPVRWIEWGLIEMILHPPSRGFGPFLLGPDRGARLWRLGGALVSCLADIPIMLAAGGLPIGRFMC